MDSLETIVAVNTATSYITQYYSEGYMSSTEVVELTGITYRKLDYWYASGVFGPPEPCGSGHRRMWHKSLIPKIVMLADLSNEFGQYSSTSIILFKRIIANWDTGCIQFSKYARLSWEV